MLDILQHRLNQQNSAGLMRTLTTPFGVDFCSNDYLGFADDDVLRQACLQRLTNIPLGATGSRLLRGNLELYEQTEELLAVFVKRKAALFFPSGYQANIALLSALLTPEDVVFSDSLNHASIIDGIRLSKAEKIIFPHRDYQFLAEQLKKAKHKLKVIITESLFSMEGTLANLPELVALANRYGALLIVDEAHSTGLWGASLVATLGLSEQVFATIHTAGKALGASGAWIAGDAILKNLLINFSRPFIFSTAPALMLLVLLQEALGFYHKVGVERAQIVLNRAAQFQQLLAKFILTNDPGPIISVLIGENIPALKISAALQQKSWDVRAIRPPTVPQGTARLRMTVKWCNTDEQIKNLAADLSRELK